MRAIETGRTRKTSSMEYSSFVEESSSTPLSTKLGIVAGTMLVLLHSPSSFSMELPPDVVVGHRVRRQADVVVTFVRSRAALSNELERLGQMVLSGGGLWIAWPKRSSGIATTLSDDVVRNLALPMGLVDNKVCAIDATWTSLRFVWRRTMRRDDQ
jgi:hypothetical protein